MAAILVDGHGPFWLTGRGAVASSAVDRTVPLKTLLRWSESLAGIARTGLGFTESLYEQERFEEILKVAADIRAEADEEPRTPTPPTTWCRSGWTPWARGSRGTSPRRWPWAPPWATTRGSSSSSNGRTRGSGSTRPGGVTSGYSAAEVVVKEVEEETGIEVEPVRLIAVLDGLRLGFTRVPLYSLLFYCRATGGTLAPHPLECSDVGWFTRDTMPSPIVGSERWADVVFAALAGEHRDVLYDSVRQPMWRGRRPEDLMSEGELAHHPGGGDRRRRRCGTPRRG